MGAAYRDAPISINAWCDLVPGDDMYMRNVERLSATGFASVLTECADAIIHLTKSIKI